MLSYAMIGCGYIYATICTYDHPDDMSRSGNAINLQLLGIFLLWHYTCTVVRSSHAHLPNHSLAERR